VLILSMLAACGGGSSSPTSNSPLPLPATSAHNYTTCNNQQVPNWRAGAFVTGYKAAVSALINHYGSNPNVGYVRVGLGRGGETNLPHDWQDTTTPCGQAFAAWGYTAGADASFTWNAYLKTVMDYEGGLNSPKKLMVSLTPVWDTPKGTDIPDFVGSVASQDGLAIGNEGLEASDIANFNASQPCGGNWCALFAQYGGQTAPLELQTFGQSCPSGTGCVNQYSATTGPLPPLLPFAIARGATNLEIYHQDWLIAFNPSDPNNGQYGAAYQSAIQTAADFATMQVLFPPSGPGAPDYAPVQAYLMNNPSVSGAVIAVEWSDFDLGNGRYDFTMIDNTLQPWINAGKKVNLVLHNTSYGSSFCPGSGAGSKGTVASNCAVPGWMWTALAQ
jgi:hypothetical protein